MSGVKDFKAEHKERLLKAVRLCMARSETDEQIAQLLHITPKQARKLVKEVKDQWADKEAEKRKEPRREPGKVYYIRYGTSAGYWWQEGYWGGKRR